MAKTKKKSNSQPSRRDPRAEKLAASLRERKDALEQQAATAEILRIIADSTESVAPVFEAITRAGLRLMPDCRVALFLLRDGQLHYMSHSGIADAGRALIAKRFPMPLDRGLVAGAAILDRRMIHVADILGSKGRYPISDTLARESKYRALLCLPLMSRGKAIGALSLGRVQPGAFTKEQIALARTFADQATIAIQNARQFNETKEALDKQTATAEILKVISGSPTDVQPVFDTIVRSAVRLADGTHAVMLRRDGDTLHLASHYNMKAAALAQFRAAYPQAISRDNPGGRAILDGKVLNIADMEETDFSPESRKRARAGGARGVLSVPVISAGVPLAAISIGRNEPGAFDESYVSLLATFADQAAIAIENVRLFNETKEALERQTSISEVLAVISSSPTDLSPILEAVASRAAKLCDATDARIFLVEGQEVRHVAGFGDLPVRTPVFELNPGTSVGTAILNGQPVHVRDIEVEADKYPLSREIARKAGWRTSLNVPLMRERKALGAIALRRREVRPFTDRQIALLKLFADQAAIAIENVRLFNETKQALERQTATSDILRVISASQRDVQPVFDALASTAARLCEATDAIIQLREGESFRFVAHHGALPNLPVGGARALTRETVTGRAILEGRQIHVRDLQAEEKEYPQGSRFAKEFDYRTILATPLMREGAAIGSIMIRRAEARPFADAQLALMRTFADQAVIAIENARLFNETKESLEKQTATADILQVLSSSPSDTQPVFDAIVRHAARLCESTYANVFRYDGERLHLAASEGVPDDVLLSLKRDYPMVPDRSRVVGRVILEARVVHVEDTRADLEYDKTYAGAMGHRRILGVPLVRGGRPVGAIAVAWAQPGPILPRHEDLLKTFADQAVIAIENVRLFNETKEALERQTATAGILKVIAGSPTDVQPVLNTVAESAARLCRSANVTVLLRDGDVLRTLATFSSEEGPTPSATHEVPVRRTFVTGRAVLEGRTVHIEDLVPLLESEYPDARDNQQRFGFRSVLAVPMMREGDAVGVLYAWRRQAGPFGPDQISLLQTFADQAVIAIENVRLFNETKEALERQTATAEILRVISSTPTDAQPVFEAIVESALRIFDGSGVYISLIEGTRLQLVGAGGSHLLEVARRDYPMPITRESVSGTAILDRRVINLADSQSPDAPSRARSNSIGFRAIACAPLLRGGEPIGALGVTRQEAGALNDKQLGLLRTFADQAVIAIENARLFNETKEALERQTATADILKVISSSPTDTKPVLDAIAQSAAQLFAPCNVGITMLEDNQLHLRAMAGPRVAQISLQEVAKVYPLAFDPATVASAKAIVERRVLEFTDMESEHTSPVTRKLAPIGQFKSAVIVPLIREDEGIGTIAITHPEAGFRLDEKQLALLKTFADQAVIAIENVRLFNETKEALERQTATSQVLSAISGSPTDVSPVYETILDNATRLCEASFAGLFLYDGEYLRNAAQRGAIPEFAKFLKETAMRPSRETATRLAALEKRVVQVEDLLNDPAFKPSDAHRAENARTVLSVPMLREGALVGVLTVWRREPRRFSEKQVALLKTFADQAVIAIENVRLFNETKEALDQQKASAEVLGAISGSIADTKPVFEKILTSCERLFEGELVGVTVADGDTVRLVAYHGPEGERLKKIYPLPLTRDSGTGWAILNAAIAHFPDIEAQGVPPGVVAGCRTLGVRAIVFAPMLFEGKGIGAIWVARAQAGAFTDKQIAQLRTFADQAVIAIQNARLVNETREALDQQKASADVLSVISSSIADAKPVFDKILESCGRLFGGHFMGVGLLGDDGMIHVAARHGPDAGELLAVDKVPVNESGSGRALAERCIIDFPDIFGQADVPPVVRRNAERANLKAVVFAPMFWEEKAIGALWVGRSFVGAFTEKQLALLKTFADQAVIAIQNARLFREIQEKSAQLEVANKHKSDFLANMSHELRTPLNAIIGFSEVLLEKMFGEVNAKQVEYLKDIHESGRHLLSLINDILDLSKIEAGRMELELSSFHLPTAVSNAITLVRERAQRHGIALGVELDPGLGEFQADERKVKQILLNLLSNAVKFTPDGGKVDVLAKALNGSVEIAVRDTGIGIAPEDQALVFEEFKQVGRDYTRKAEGTGLGLALTKRLVELHGGEIALESAPGKGSTFTVRLPLR